MRSAHNLSSKECKLEIFDVSHSNHKENSENSLKESTCIKDSLIKDNYNDKFAINLKGIPSNTNPEQIKTNNFSEQMCGQERKKKYKPDQLILIKTLLTLNFFGVVIILINLLFVYIQLISLYKDLELLSKILIAITFFETIANIIYFLSWSLFFVSTLKRKLLCLKISVFMAWISFFVKIISFLMLQIEFCNNNGNIGVVVASCIFICFQFFSIWNYSYVYSKMAKMNEKSWKKAFRRPKGKYMYSQD